MSIHHLHQPTKKHHQDQIDEALYIAAVIAAAIAYFGLIGWGVLKFLDHFPL